MRMRLQFSSLVMYEQRRAIAVSNTRDADFDLVDANGNVELSYRQTITWERDTAAYDAACNPPIDDSMERMEQRLRRLHEHHERQNWRASPRRSNQRAKPTIQPFSSPVSFTGKPLDVSYKTGDRPRGNVAVW